MADKKTITNLKVNHESSVDSLRDDHDFIKKNLGTSNLSSKPAIRRGSLRKKKIETNLVEKKPEILEKEVIVEENNEPENEKTKDLNLEKIKNESFEEEQAKEIHKKNFKKKILKEVKNESLNKVNLLKLVEEENNVEIIEKPNPVLSYKKKEGLKRKKKHSFNPRKKNIYITSSVTIPILAKTIGKKIGQINKILKQLNFSDDLNQLINPEIAQLVAEELNVNLVLKIKSIEDKLQDKPSTKNLQSRPPIVTIMGHVDHGKTSLLDCIRNSRIVDKESGNITQHIGAYYVQTKNGNITFLDTPGHEAFSKMRTRGSSITDIVILIVAADDGVKAQTIEAIQQAKNAKINIIVVITKCDKQDINTKKIIESLMQYDLIAEEYGGDIPILKTSSKTKEGIDDLLELILLIAENLNIKSNLDAKANGIIIESKVDKNRGNLATLLIKNGTIKVGDYLLCGNTYGKIRTITNDSKKQLKTATASMPIEITGLHTIPQVGVTFQVTEEKIAKAIAENNSIKEKEQKTVKNSNIEDLFLEQTSAKEVFFIFKVDVYGLIEVIEQLVKAIENEQIKPKIVAISVGNINLSDINLAIKTVSRIICFNVNCDNEYKKIAEKENIIIDHYNVIYKLVDKVKEILSDKLIPIIHEKLQGKAKVLDTFYVTKVGQIAGCKVTLGKIIKDSTLKILRDDNIIYQNKITTLKQFKNNISEVSKGNECGLSIKGYKNFKSGDIVECYSQTEEKIHL